MAKAPPKLDEMIELIILALTDLQDFSKKHVITKFKRLESQGTQAIEIFKESQRNPKEL